jgi:Domain of unknown function (DUF5615)
VKISFYLDEDSQSLALIKALRTRGVDVLSSWDAGMHQRLDEDHLLFATSQNRVLYGFNVGDYQQLHSQFLSQGTTHAGIVLAKQQVYLVGKQMRRLLRIVGAKSADDMQNHIEFLGSWG